MLIFYLQPLLLSLKSIQRILFIIYLLESLLVVKPSADVLPFY